MTRTIWRTRSVFPGCSQRFPRLAADSCTQMAKNDSKRPIGFGSRMDPDPNGTGDGWRLHESEQQPEPAPEKPPRPPKAVPVFVGTSETLEILSAYDLFPLTPLSPLEQQLVQVVAGLEKRIEELE